MNHRYQQVSNRALEAVLAARRARSEQGEIGEDRLVRGSRVGRYVILTCLGAGATGEVYAAYDSLLGREVALKVVAPRRTVRATGSLDDVHASARALIMREARAMARLCHPSLVSLYEVVEHDGALFLAMERVRGRDLYAWFAEETRSAEEILAVFAAVARGLAAAHAAGVVHGDVKPEHIIIDDAGRARLVDFGLAVPVGAGAGLRPFGTPRYMAPEQLRGLAFDGRADQFALCVALYRALYGEWPFAGRSVPEIAYAVLHTPARRPSVRRGSAALERAIMTGLAADPAERHASMEDLARLLEARPPRRRRLFALKGLFGG